MGKRGPKPENLVGRKYGKLTVIDVVPRTAHSRTRVKCQCECGNTILALAANVKSGNTRSCGCGRNYSDYTEKQLAKAERQASARIQNYKRKKDNGGTIVGLRFGRLVVQEKAGRKGKDVAYRCLCDCGAEKLVVGSSLMNGDTRSCGCLAKDVTHALLYENGDSNPGSANRRLYGIWAGMKERCQNTDFRDYYRYGGRGITVCDEWQNWVDFRDWALSHGYQDDLSLDRIDNESGYRPDNCRWATASVQTNNTRANLKIVFHGSVYTGAQFARLTDIPYSFVGAKAHQGFNGEDILIKTSIAPNRLLADNVPYVR